MRDREVLLFGISVLVLGGSSGTRHSCPVAARAALPELTGSWAVLMINGLDRQRPDTMRARSTIAVELRGCLLRERLLSRAGRPPYEALVLWGTNGPDSAVQRIFAHSQHGRFGVYQGRRVGAEIVLRQENLSAQPDSIVVEHRVHIRDRDHFMLTSQLSNDHGRTWVALSRWEYRRAPQ